MKTGDIGKKIAALRERKGYSQKEFSKIIHISQPTLSHWENGYSLPTLSMIEEICEKLGVGVEELLQGNPSEYDRLKKRYKILKNGLISAAVLVAVILTIKIIPKYTIIDEYNSVDASMVNKTIVIRPTLFYREEEAIAFCDRLFQEYSVDSGISMIEIQVVKSSDYVNNQDLILFEYAHIVESVEEME